MRPPFFWVSLAFVFGVQAACLIVGVAAYVLLGLWGAFAIFAIVVGVRYALASDVLRFAVVSGVGLFGAIAAYESAGGAHGLLIVLACVAVAQYAASSREGREAMAEVAATLDSFHEASRILRDASVEVHSIEPAGPPNWRNDGYDECRTVEDFDDPVAFEDYALQIEEEEQEHAEWTSTLDWYEVEATITPDWSDEESIREMDATRVETDHRRVRSG